MVGAIRAASQAAAFDRFLAALRRSPGGAVRAWETEIEAALPGIYREFVWDAHWRRDWKARRRRVLADLLPGLPRRAAAIRRELRAMPGAIRAAGRSYRRLLGVGLPRVEVHGIVSLTFNGKVGTLTGAPGATLVVFGVDDIVRQGAPRRIVYAHELFHAIHGDAMGLEDRDFASGALLLQLWMEGLATWASGRAVRGASRAGMLMDRRLAGLRGAALGRLATAFLGDVPAETPERRAELLAKWFLGTPAAGAPPARAAYALGLAVAEHLAASHTLAAMTRWTPAEARVRAREELVRLSAPTSARGRRRSAPRRR